MALDVQRQEDKIMVRNAVIISFLGKTRDRFAEYNEDRSTAERLAMASRMEGIDGIEAVFPYLVKDPEYIVPLMTQYGLEWAAVNVNVKGEPEFRNGGLTSPEKEVRAKAIQFIRSAKDFAESVGANKVTCCPLSDGYEFAFQCDYAQSWRYLVESLGEGAAYKPQIPLFIEYKPRESRGHCFVDSSAKTLVLLRDIGVDGMGVTIDFGHSLIAGENPAEAVCLVAESGVPYYIHINDNDGRWDWDYFVGSKNLLAYIEFLYYLQKYGYSDFLTADTSPTRWDITRNFETNARLSRKIWNRLQELDQQELHRLIHADDYMATWKFIETQILNL
jgi:xylose isomerase